MTALGLVAVRHGPNPRIESLSETGSYRFACDRSAGQAGCAYACLQLRTRANRKVGLVETIWQGGE